MLTLKLSRRNKEIEAGDQILFTTKIVEATEVEIHQLREGELSEAQTKNGDHWQSFYIANRSKGRPSGYADEVQFWDSAWIENSSGATTSHVRF